MDSNTDIQNRHAKLIWDAWNHADCAWCDVHNLANQTAAYIAEDVNDHNGIVKHFNWIYDKIESLSELYPEDYADDPDFFEMVDELHAAADLAEKAVDCIKWIQSAACMVWPKVDNPVARAARAARAIKCMANAEANMWTDLEYDHDPDHVVWRDAKNHAAWLCFDYYNSTSSELELLWSAIKRAAISAANEMPDDPDIATIARVSCQGCWAEDSWSEIEYMDWIGPNSRELLDLIPL